MRKTLLIITVLCIFMILNAEDKKIGISVGYNSSKITDSYIEDGSGLCGSLIIETIKTKFNDSFDLINQFEFSYVEKINDWPYGQISFVNKFQTRQGETKFSIDLGLYSAYGLEGIAQLKKVDFGVIIGCGVIYDVLIIEPRIEVGMIDLASMDNESGCRINSMKIMLGSKF